MTREEAENLLDEFLDKYETMKDYERREDYIAWTQGAEDNAVSAYTELREKLIEDLEKSNWYLNKAIEYSVENDDLAEKEEDLDNLDPMLKKLWNDYD